MAKARANLAKHHVPMQAGAAVFDDPRYLLEENRFARGEQRFIAIGMVRAILLTVLFSEPDEDMIRLISVRRATKTERRVYENQLR